MKYIFSILFLLLATQTLGHGEHQATDGVIFYLERESGKIVLDATSLAEVREAIQKRRSQKNNSSGFREVFLKDRGLDVAKRAETKSGLPVGQILLVVDDTRLGAVTLPLHPVHAYSSHSHIVNHGASKVGERAYFSIPKSALRHASSFEIRRVIADAASDLIKKIELGG
tara:strand:+ start:2604 stop:3113 length:510 start_codon:yes stop_codon:yes gene_type:complete